MPYFFNSPGKAHPSPLLSWKDTPILKCRIFSVLLEKHTLRPCYPGKTHLLSWKDTPAILERHTCYPGKTHLLSWKDTPAILERHTCYPGKTHPWTPNLLIFLGFWIHK